MTTEAWLQALFWTLVPMGAVTAAVLQDELSLRLEQAMLGIAALMLVAGAVNELMHPVLNR